MKFNATEIPEVILVEPDVHGDERGFFLETWHRRKYAEGGIGVDFVQDNHSRSRSGILRGLHMQLRNPQGKLVSCVEGAVFDVAVDVRVGSPTFGRHVTATLSAQNHHQLWVPAGFAHGYCVTTETAQFEYKCTDFYDPDDELTIAWNDPALAISWPIESPLLSAKDEAGEPLADVQHRLPRYDPGV